MCETCGCGQRKITLTVGEALLSENERWAQKNRAWFKKRQVKVINLIGSPGAGKTSLIEATARLWNQGKIAVIEGDPETQRDAERLSALGLPVAAVTTGGVCHLDARMVHQAFHQLVETDPHLLFIENVGNLLCPADFDLGEDLSVVVLSVTEGEDKPEKYPQAFRRAQVLVLTKIDLLPYVDFSLDRCLSLARQINPSLKVLPLSLKTGEGLSDWLEFLRS